MSRIKTLAAESDMSLENASQKIMELAACQRKIHELTLQADAEIVKINNELVAVISPLNDKINELFNAIHMWAEVNRKSICAENKKSANLATGVLAWRKTPEKVNINNKEKVVEQLKRLKNNNYLRVTHEVNKEYVLSHREGVKNIKGLSITQKEEFSVKPYSTNIDIAVKVK